MISEKPTPYLLIKCYSNDNYDNCGGYAFVYLSKSILESLPLLKNNLEILQANFEHISNISMWDTFDVLTSDEVEKIEDQIGILVSDIYYLCDHYEADDVINTEEHELEITENYIRHKCCHGSSGNTYHVNSISWETINEIIKTVEN